MIDRGSRVRTRYTIPPPIDGPHTAPHVPPGALGTVRRIDSGYGGLKGAVVALDGHPIPAWIPLDELDTP